MFHHYPYSFATKISAMGPGEAIESISFMKESDKYSLHQILWDNEDHLSNAIIAMRLVVNSVIKSYSKSHAVQSVSMIKLGTSSSETGDHSGTIGFSIPADKKSFIGNSVNMIKCNCNFTYLLYWRNTNVNNINAQLEAFLGSMAPTIDDHVLKQARKVFYHVSHTHCMIM